MERFGESDMRWSGKRALVTGAGGFIGSHLAERLVECGVVTRAFVHYRSDGSRGWLEPLASSGAVEVVSGEIWDRDIMRQAMDGVDTVFHLAALIAIPYSYQAPHAYVRANVEGTLTVLQAAREAGVQRVIHTSTSEVYGTAQRVPMDERHPISAQSPYAASKAGADQLAQSYWRSFGLPVVTLRPFNTFGPRQSARAIVPTIITQCLASRTVALGNVTPSRDVNYVSNIVDAYLLAAEQDAAVGRTIHLGSGREISIEALARLIADLSGIPIKIVTEETRVRPKSSEVERLVADATLAKQLLGWMPAVSLEDGLRRTIDWMREHQDAYHAGAFVL